MATRDIVGRVARAARARRGVPHDPRRVLRRGAGARSARSRRSSRTCAGSGILVDRDDEGYLLQIFTKPLGDRPDALLRDHRAPRRARLRRGQLQGPVRGDRARAGPAGQPLRHALRDARQDSRQAPRAGAAQRRRLAAADRGGHGLRGLLGQRVDPATTCIRPAGSTRSASSARSSARSGCPTPTCTGWPTPTRSSPAATRCRGRRLLMWNGDIEVSVCKPTEELEASTATARATRSSTSTAAAACCAPCSAASRSASATTW